MAYEANPLAANYGAYLGGEGAELGAEGAAAGSEGAGAGAGEIAGSTAGGWLALAYMAYRAWDNLTQGSHQNEPMRATRDIAYGGRDLASLLQGRPLDPEIGLTRYTQEPGNSWVDPGTTMLTAGRYGQENIPELYNYLHSISRGGNQGRGGNAPGWFLTGNFWSGDNYGSGRGEPTHITDEDVDNFLYAQGVTREQLSQALGYTPPDWATTTWSQWEPQMANQAIAAREQRVREGLATDADIQYYRDYANQYNVPGGDPWSQISLEQSPFYQDYWTALQARDPNLPQQAVSLEEGV
jgi:hypothetical protein